MKTFMCCALIALFAFAVAGGCSKTQVPEASKAPDNQGQTRMALP